jgi:hypothetical protein
MVCRWSIYTVVYRCVYTWYADGLYTSVYICCMVCAWSAWSVRGHRLHNVASIGCSFSRVRCKHLQVSLVLLFTASQSVYLFRRLQYIYDTDSPFRIIGFRSLDEVVGLMIGFNLIVLLAFVGMVVYQAFTQPAAGNFRLVTNRQPPELTLANKMRYHLFLSHVGHCRSNLATNL